MSNSALASWAGQSRGGECRAGDRMDPAKIDENLAFLKSQILPRIKAGAGFQAVRSMANRKTGQGIGGTVWKSRDAMKAAAETAKSLREQGKRGA